MNRQPESTIAAAVLIDLIRYLERAGVAAEDLCRALGIDAVVMENPGGRIPSSLMGRLWEYAARATGDDHLGLHTAENFNPGALHILGYVLLSCRTAREALGRLVTYSALLNDGMRVSVADSDGLTECRFAVVESDDNYLRHAPRQGLEAMSCGTLVTMRRLTTVAIEPVAVAFQHAAPADTSEHLRIFGPVVKFGQAENLVVFRTADLSAGLLSANPALLAMFEAQAKQILDHLDQRGPVSRRVMALLARRITAAAPTLEAVAVELAMSERTLQRELRVETTTFRQLVEDVRREVAVQYLAQPGASASEAAFLLGFSEPSAFTRAFRRWTGAAPTQFQSA